jgi:hypothetical protein
MSAVMPTKAPSDFFMFLTLQLNRNFSLHRPHSP